MAEGRLAALSASAPARFVQKFMDDRALTLASLLAWGMLNTFLPVLLGVLALIGFFLGDSPAAAAAQEKLFALLPAQASTLVRGSITSTQQVAGAAGLVSLGLLLFNGSNLFVTLESVFDLVYHVPERNLITQRLVSFAALFVLAGLLLIDTVAAAVGGIFGEGVLSVLPHTWTASTESAASGVSVVGVLVTFLLMYWVLPNTHNSLRESLPGALVASVLFVVVLRIFPLYVKLFGQGFSVYAAFGTVLVFMFWLYIVGVVVIGGAVLNAFLKEPERSVALSSLSARALTGRLELPPTGADGAA